MRKLLGHCSVDSGQLFVVDPCYLEKEWDDEYREGVEPEGGRYPMNYAGCCAATMSKDQGAQVDHGVAFTSGWGDGSYPVYAEYKDGRISRIVIDFEAED